jgi:uncharacterized alkaline shock family protein YloU
MSIQLLTSLGRIHVADEVIETLAGSAALECDGLVGMAPQKMIKDGLFELIKKENYGKGIVVRHEHDGLNIDLFVIVRYGTKISLLAQNIQNAVRNMINHRLGIQVKCINVFIQGVRSE